MNKQPGSHDTIFRITIIFWLVGKIISWKIWTVYRFFPLVPVFDWLDNVPAMVHNVLFAASLLTMCVLLIRPDKTILIWVLIALELVSCALDQNRMQPWGYQYMFTVFLFAVNRKTPQRILPGLLFILCATYLYSAVQKFNPGFIYLVWENVMLRVLLGTPQSGWGMWMHRAGYLMPLLEVSAGLGLIFTVTRRQAAIFLICMHVLMIYVVGPLGLACNVIVWPWNVLMCIMLYMVAVAPPQNFKPQLADLWGGWNKLILLFWGILPAFNFFGCWDKWLSCSLYSGRVPFVVVCLKNDSIPAGLKQYAAKPDAFKVCDGAPLIFNLQTWCMDETAVPPYPEMRVYKKVREKFMKAWPATGAQFNYGVYPFTGNSWKKIE